MMAALYSQFVSDEIIEKIIEKANTTLQHLNMLILYLADEDGSKEPSCKILDSSDTPTDYDGIDSGEEFNIIHVSNSLFDFRVFRTPILPSMLKATNIESFDTDNIPGGFRLN